MPTVRLNAGTPPRLSGRVIRRAAATLPAAPARVTGPPLLAPRPMHVALVPQVVRAPAPAPAVVAAPVVDVPLALRRVQPLLGL
jgi:hypothetical protein